MLGVGGSAPGRWFRGRRGGAVIFGYCPHMTSPSIASRPETVAFGDLIIYFDSRLLRPRHWTTAQSYWASALLKVLVPGPVLELCAGAGQIGLLAVAGHERDLVAVDAEPAAAEFITLNACVAGLEDRVEVRVGDLDEVIDPAERFALIIADPPWVRHDQVHLLPEDPEQAIDGGVDGLEIARRCVRVIDEQLHAGGAALLQLGSAGQAEQLADELSAAGSLRVVETREYPGQGVLVLLTRNPAAIES